MHHPTVKATIEIFERMYRNLPPLVPEQVVADMGVAVDQIRANPDLDVDEIETTMLVFAKKIWAYNQAFQEIVASYDARMGEKLFLQHLTPSLRKKYAAFCEHGHTFADLHSSATINFFFPEDRVELHKILVTISCDVRGLAVQAVLHGEKKKYLDRIQEFEEILYDIDQQLEDLLQLAENEQEHPVLAAEIREHVKGFEHSIALLGPGIDFEAVCNAREHFRGRKQRHKERV